MLIERRLLPSSSPLEKGRRSETNDPLVLSHKRFTASGKPQRVPWSAVSGVHAGLKNCPKNRQVIVVGSDAESLLREW